MNPKPATPTSPASTHETTRDEPLLRWECMAPDTDGWECYRGTSGELHIGSVYRQDNRGEEPEQWLATFNLRHSPVFEQFPHENLQAAREAVELHYRQALPHLAADARKASE